MRNAITVVSFVSVFASVVSAGRAETIWTGPMMTFAKPNSAGWTLPQNQDRLTDNVWITRKNTQGIFNIAQEAGYTHNVSPTGTRWADGAANDWQSLSFADWEHWATNNPPGTVGRDAVLHLVQDDVYLDIKFLSWTSSGGGGGFSYQRSTPVPEPSMLVLAAAGLATVMCLAARSRDRNRRRSLIHRTETPIGQ